MVDPAFGPWILTPPSQREQETRIVHSRNHPKWPGTMFGIIIRDHDTWLKSLNVTIRANSSSILQKSAGSPLLSMSQACGSCQQQRGTAFWAPRVHSACCEDRNHSNLCEFMINYRKCYSLVTDHHFTILFIVIIIIITIININTDRLIMISRCWIFDDYQLYDRDIYI